MRATNLVIVVTTLLLGACSTPYVYQKEIDSFSTSVTAVSNAVTQGITTVTQDQVAADLAVVVKGRKGVNLPAECSLESTAPCRLQVPGEQPGDDIRAKLAALKPDILEVVSTLKSYAEGLAAVTNAQDRKDYDAAATQLASSVGALGTALGAVTGAGAPVGPALSALVTLGTSIIGQSLDEARFQTLKSAINAVGMPSKDLGGEAPIKVVVDKGITPTLTAVRSVRITLLSVQLNATADRINKDLAGAGAAKVSLERYDQPLTDLGSLVTALNSNKAVNAAAVGSSLLEAHNDLLKAVNDPSKQFKNIVASISDFATKAAAVQKAFTQVPAPAAAATK